MFRIFGFVFLIFLIDFLLAHNLIASPIFVDDDLVVVVVVAVDVTVVDIVIVILIYSQTRL